MPKSRVYYCAKLRILLKIIAKYIAWIQILSFQIVYVNACKRNYIYKHTNLKNAKYTDCKTILQQDVAKMRKLH